MIGFLQHTASFLFDFNGVCLLVLIFMLERDVKSVRLYILPFEGKLKINMLCYKMLFLLYFLILDDIYFFLFIIFLF